MRPLIMFLMGVVVASFLPPVNLKFVAWVAAALVTFIFLIETYIKKKN